MCVAVGGCPRFTADGPLDLIFFEKERVSLFRQRVLLISASELSVPARQRMQTAAGFFQPEMFL